MRSDRERRNLRFMMVRYHALQKIVSHRDHHKGDEREAQRMRQDGAIAAFAFWKRANKSHNATPKIHRQSENSSELDHDRVHFPEPIMQIDMQQRFADAQMSGGTHRKKLG